MSRQNQTRNGLKAWWVGFVIFLVCTEIGKVKSISVSRSLISLLLKISWSFKRKAEH